MEKWTAYCMTCKAIVTHCGEPVEWPNGPMVDAAAKLHAKECEHEVIVGYRVEK
jgi:hypothetical protein